MGLQEALNEFKEFETSVSEMKDRITEFMALVQRTTNPDCIQTGGTLIKSNIPIPDICIEGYTLDISSSKLYLRSGEKKKNWRDMNTEELVRLYKILPQIVGKFSEVLIDHISKDSESRMKRFESFMFEHSL